MGSLNAIWSMVFECLQHLVAAVGTSSDQPGCFALNDHCLSNWVSQPLIGNEQPLLAASTLLPILSLDAGLVVLAGGILTGVAWWQRREQADRNQPDKRTDPIPVPDAAGAEQQSVSSQPPKSNPLTEVAPVGAAVKIASLEQQLRELTESLAKAHQDLARSQGVQHDFLANIGHELLSPMSTIAGMTDLALSETSNSTLRDYLLTAKDSARTLQKSLTEVLDYARIRAGDLVLAQRPFSLRELLDAALRGVVSGARARGLTLSSEISSEVPDLAWGDPARLRQVMEILIASAIKHAEHGGVVIRITAAELQRESFCARVEIGPNRGAAPIEPRAFVPFQPVADVSPRPFAQGLGLAIANELIEMFDGTLSVGSVSGPGSSYLFNVCLDRQTPANEQSVVIPGTNTSSVGFLSKSSLERRGRPLKVLVAEDTVANQKLLQSILRKFGHESSLACDGEEAVDMAAKQDFDLVLMDVQMPRMDGHQATTAIRDREQTQGQHVPIIAITAQADAANRDRCLEAGADAYLTKPFDVAELRDLIDRLCCPAT